jgi:hypothetical protein
MKGMSQAIDPMAGSSKIIFALTIWRVRTQKNLSEVTAGKVPWWLSRGAKEGT